MALFLRFWVSSKPGVTDTSIRLGQSQFTAGARHASLSLGYEDCQHLMNEMWSRGMRPTYADAPPFTAGSRRGR